MGVEVDAVKFAVHQVQKNGQVHSKDAKIHFLSIFWDDVSYGIQMNEWHRHRYDLVLRNCYIM